VGQRDIPEPQIQRDAPVIQQQAMAASDGGPHATTVLPTMPVPASADGPAQVLGGQRKFFKTDEM
jgi:hypothetical protein